MQTVDFVNLQIIQWVKCRWWCRQNPKPSPHHNLKPILSVLQSAVCFFTVGCKLNIFHIYNWLAGCASQNISPSYWQYIHGTFPSYLQSCFTRVSDMTSRRRLLSSTSHRLDVPPIRLSTVGRRAFPVSGATVGTNCLSTSHLHHHSRFSDDDSRPFCFPFLPKHYHTTSVGRGYNADVRVCGCYNG